MDIFYDKWEQWGLMLLAFNGWGDIAMLVMYAAFAIAAIWLAWSRKKHHLITYSVYASGFFALALGVWPGYAIMNMIGMAAIVVATGFHIFMGVLMDSRPPPERFLSSSRFD